VRASQLKLHMVGAAPDPSKLPNGWPTELELRQRGGALVVADNASFGFFLSFVFFMLNMLSLPLQPLVGMLTMREPAAEGSAADEGTVDAADGGAANAAATSTESAASASDEPGSAV
jgi:hypothetical protein